LPITEANVTNLVTDLAARPQKSSTYATSHAAIIDASGNIASVAGNNADCVHVDGSSGACGSATFPAYVDNETPAGNLNGVNKTFTLTQPPAPAGSLSLFRNGIMQRAGTDYTLSGATVTFTPAAPQSGDVMVAFYRVTGTGPSVLFTDGETPTGTIDGVNTTFTLLNAPAPTGSLQLFKNGALLRATVDFTLTGNTVVFINGALPQAGDSLIANYRH
jgi:hypothetical protein